MWQPEQVDSGPRAQRLRKNYCLLHLEIHRAGGSSPPLLEATAVGLAGALTLADVQAPEEHDYGGQWGLLQGNHLLDLGKQQETLPKAPSQMIKKVLLFEKPAY